MLEKRFLKMMANKVKHIDGTKSNEFINKIFQIERDQCVMICWMLCKKKMLRKFILKYYMDVYKM